MERKKDLKNKIEAAVLGYNKKQLQMNQTHETSNDIINVLPKKIRAHKRIKANDIQLSFEFINDIQQKKSS